MSGIVNITNVEYSEEAILSLGRDRAASAAEWITVYYGRRCDEWSPNCPCCQKWGAWDQLFADVLIAEPESSTPCKQVVRQAGA